MAGNIWPIRIGRGRLASTRIVGDPAGRHGGREISGRASGVGRSRVCPVSGPGIRPRPGCRGVVVGGAGHRAGRPGAAPQLDHARGRRRPPAPQACPAGSSTSSEGRANRLVFDFDDAVLYRDSYDPRGPHCPRRGSALRRRSVQTADVVRAGNDFSPTCSRRRGGPRTSRSSRPASRRTSIPPPSPTRGNRGSTSSGSAPVQHPRRPRNAAATCWERIGRDVDGARLRPDLRPLHPTRPAGPSSPSPGPRRPRPPSWPGGTSASVGCPTTSGRRASAA